MGKFVFLVVNMQSERHKKNMFENDSQIILGLEMTKKFFKSEL